MRALIAALFPWSCCAPKSNGAIDLLWPTPVLSLHDPVAEATNKQLRKAILRIAAVEPGVQKTNQGGWQSAVDLFERNDAAFITLRTRAYYAAFKYLQNLAPAGTTGKFEVSLGSAWANVNNHSHENTPHMHPGAHLAGVYYVDDGGDRDGGLRLVDPRAQASMIPVPARWTRGMGEHVRVQSMPGLFVIFPSWLQHYVSAHAGGRPRISVSFNLRVTYPPDGDESIGDGGGGGFVGSAAAVPADAPPARLSYTVPSHHQQAFLDSRLAQDMVIG